MRTIKDDRHHGITIQHNGDWSGNVHVTWRSRRAPTDDEVKANAASPIYKACSPYAPPHLPCEWSHLRIVDGMSLLAGFWSPRMDAALEDPPLNVITRAVALAVERYLTRRVQSAVEDITIPRENR